MKEVVNYKKGEFVDFEGQTHQFIVAAVSTTNIVEDGGELCLTLYDEYGIVDERTLDKALFIGVSVCNPKDEFDEEKGKLIAYNKAITAKHLNHPAMFTTRPGYINTEVVEALLNNIVKYIERDPGSVVSGYNLAEKKHLKKIEDENLILNSSMKMKDTAEYINSLSKEEKKDLEKLIGILQ